MTARVCFIVIIIALLAGGAHAADPMNLALGRPVTLVPPSNYSTTSSGGTDAWDLTDGAISTRSDQRIYVDPKSVGYTYPGLVQIRLDLGAQADIGEVAIRFQGGSESAGSSFPIWVELAASDDGVHYYRVSGYSRFTPGDQAKYGVPSEGGISWVHKLRFQNINIRARYIGIAFYGTAYCATDELYVMSGDSGASYATITSLPAIDFCVTGPRFYFHKPVVMLPTNMNAPTPIGMLVPTTFTQTVTAQIDLPTGVRFAGGSIGGKSVTSLTGTPTGDGFTRYTFTVSRSSAKDWSRVYMRYDADAGTTNVIRYQLSWTGSSAPMIEQPIKALAMGSAPQPRRMMAGLGWWALGNTIAWSNAVNDFKSLGFNTLPLFAHSTNFNDATTTQTIAQFRAAGFKVVNIDSPFHVMIGAAGSRVNELYCQFAGGTTGTKFCPSYRGDLYTAELARFADECAKAKPDYISPDIELWDSSGPVDAQNCTRCQADYAASGATSWNEWKLTKGEQIWRDLVNAIRTKDQQLGIKVPEIGCYDFRPGINYQKFWPYDRLYPDYLGDSQVSTYSPLYPYNIIFIGNEARQDRQRLPKSDVLPYITPGDAGTFPGEMFTWALLECYANGSRGVYFWSPRVWDAETLDAHARALRIIAPVEDVIVDGQLASGVTCNPAMRVSGMRRGRDYFLLIAKEYEPYSGAVTVTLPDYIPADVIDLDSGSVVAKITAGKKDFNVTFNNQRARVLQVKPISTAAKKESMRMK